MEGERERGRKGGRRRGREGGRKERGGREGGREGGRRKGGGRERERGREGGMEGGREEREGSTCTCKSQRYCVLDSFYLSLLMEWLVFPTKQSSIQLHFQHVQ